MFVFLLKSDQLGLFEKIVPVKGSVHKDGKFTKPHYARRKVRPDEAAPMPLFAAPNAENKPAISAKPKAEPKPKPEKAAGDLFDHRPAAVEAPANPEKPREPEKPKAKPRAKPKSETKPEPAEAVAEPEKVAAPAPPGFYNRPFDPIAVPPFGVPAGTSKDERRRLNAEAVALVNSKDQFTDAERAILRQYSGNGGVGDSLNEFYTDPKVAAAMWYALRGMGLAPGAEVLEPSAATGVFLETAMPGVKVAGVELDPTSAKIGAALHPGHSIDNASLERFAVQDTRQFDAVIGNVPFGLRGSLIKDDKLDLKTAEAYFLDTAIDKTKPGGIVALIVPTGVMDGKNTRALRERLLRKAEFLGAIRMPNTAFEHSHTEVTSDIVYFRKRPQDVAGALMTVKQGTLKGLGVWDDEYLSGGYFRGRGAGNILGTMEAGWRAKAGMGDDITVVGTMAGVPDAIAGFRPAEGDAAQPTMPAILAALGDDEAAKERAITASLKRPYDNAKPGDTKVVDGVTYILQGKPPRWHRVDEFLQTPAVSDAQELAAEIDRLMTGQVADRPKLEAAIHAYVEKHGIPSKNADLQLAAHQDKSLYRLIGAVKPDGSLSDVVAGREAKPTESTFEAAALALATEQGDFTPEQVAGRWHQGTAEDAKDHLYASTDYALNPDGTWTSTDNYLSGELWPKLDAAKAKIARGNMSPEDKAKFERQARLLEETIDPKLLEDVEIAVNSAFLPLNIVSAYFTERRNENEYSREEKPIKITFERGIYKIENGGWGTKLLENYLNRTGVKKDDLPAIDKMNAEFKAWFCASKFRDEVEDLYNRRFRGFRQRGYSDSPLEVPGLTTDKAPNAYHWAGLRWALEAGKGIVAADVGLGKTPRGLMLAKLLKTTGKAKKPMIVVPKSVLGNWVAEIESWFPGSTVMTIGETFSKDKNGNLKGRQDTAAERNRKLHDITQNDYDFILISQPSWNDLDIDPITKGEYANEDFWVQRGDALGNAGDKRLNKIREAHKQALAQREFQKRTDAIYFNDLGIDAIIGDEFQAFKNLYAARNRFGQSPKFLGGQGLSNRALDMNFKSRWVRERNNGNNVYGLSATPTKNSPLEIYSMLSHIAPEAFVKIGVRNSEEFLDRFVEFKNETILNTRGEIEEALVTTGFKNLDELREIMRRYIDRKTAADVGLKLPGRDDRLHTVDMSAQQKAVYADLREMAKEAAGKRDATGDMHIFSIMDKMGKAAMDLELLDSTAYAGADSPKYDAAAKEIVDGAKSGGQVVFADSLGVHEKMANKLVAAGIPRDRIAIINAQVAPTSAQRQNIADAFNARKLDVVVGNTATMGEGINLQKATTDVHHMDLTWEPASIQQRNGRGLRQGNKMESVKIHTYLAKGSFDGYRYQSLMAKKDWQDLLWNGGDRVENLSREGNVSRDDMLIMLAADPDAARAKYNENKTAAKQKYEEQQRGMAAGQFARLQEMKLSFAQLKRKDSDSANRLRIKIERAKTALHDNPNFAAKHALNGDKPMLVQPHTGEAFETGSAFDVADAPDAPTREAGKFVVTSINLLDNTVSARPYGSTGRSTMFKLDDLKSGVKPFKYDEGEEKAEIARTLAAEHEGKVGGVSSMKDLVALPHSVIKDSYAKLQDSIKGGMKDYSFHHDYGAIPLVDSGGNAVAAESYNARDMLGDHDVMLPIPEHRKKAKAAYIADERAKNFTHDYHQKRRGGRTESRFVVRYPGSHNQSSNRWGSIGRHLFGQDFEKEAHGEFERSQHEAARRAKTFEEAMSHVAPAIDVDYSGAKWPKRGLAVLWAQAKRTGKLDESMDRAMPRKKVYGADVPVLPTELFSQADQYHRSQPINTRQPVRDVLINLAKGAGHYDLAAAMIASGAKDPRDAVQELLKMPTTHPAVVSGLRHMADRHPALGQMKMHDIGYYGPGVGESTTLDDLVDELDGDDDEGGDDERAAA